MITLQQLMIWFSTPDQEKDQKNILSKRSVFLLADVQFLTLLYINNDLITYFKIVHGSAWYQKTFLKYIKIFSVVFIPNAGRKMKFVEHFLENFQNNTLMTTLFSKSTLPTTAVNKSISRLIKIDFQRMRFKCSRV